MASPHKMPNRDGYLVPSRSRNAMPPMKEIV
jgi:hypothetical protein